MSPPAESPVRLGNVASKVLSSLGVKLPPLSGSDHDSQTQYGSLAAFFTLR